MKFEKEYAELYGFILGDGTFRDSRYKQMTFYNCNLDLIKYVKNIIEKISGKKVNICQRRRGKSIEYCINLPSNITRKLIELDCNKKKIPAWIINSKFGIYFLKAFYECEGSLNNFQIMIYQSDEQILEDCVKIANNFGLSAHVHASSKNRDRDFYLAIENLDKVKYVFKSAIKPVNFTKAEKGSIYNTKREILRMLMGKKYLTTTEILNELENKDIKISKRSNVLLNKHLKPLCKKGILSRRKGYLVRNDKGMFVGIDSEWKLKKKFTDAQILNYPYGT